MKTLTQLTIILFVFCSLINLSAQITASDQIYFISSPVHVKYILPEDGGTAQRALLSIGTKNGLTKDNFEWKVQDAGEGWFYLVHVKSGLVMDVQWGNSRAGTPLWLWPKSTSDAQKFRFESIEGGKYRIYNKLNTSLRLDIADGQLVMKHKNAFVPTQIWMLVSPQPPLTDDGGGVVSGPNAYAIYDGPIGSCTSEVEREMEAIARGQLGVDGYDPRHAYIGSPAARKRRFGRNWYPVDGYKRTLCGTMHQFAVHRSYFDQWLSGFTGIPVGIDVHEIDWNINIIPDPGFGDLIEEVLPYKWGKKDRHQWHNCGGTPCMEAEVTPVPELFDLPEFSVRDKLTTLTNEKVCTYGPWVREEVHGNRPEIHPSELFWWGDERTKHLLVVQDNSNRFDDTSDFRDEPDGWKPWAEGPIYSTFKLPFSVKVGAETAIYHISIPRSHHIITDRDPEASRDIAHGRKYAILYDAYCPVFVEEAADSDAKVGVRFESVCYNRDNSTINGYIVISTVVGSRENEGYALIEVRKNVEGPTQTNIPPPIHEPYAASIEQVVSGTNAPFIYKSFQKGSLYSEKVNGKNYLSADFEVKTLKEGEVSKITKGTVIDQSYVIPSSLKGTFKSGVLSNVMVPNAKSTASNLEIMNNGRIDGTLEINPVTVFPDFEACQITSEKEQSTAWNSLARYLDAKQRDKVPGSLMQLQKVSLEVLPAYTLVREGALALAEEDEIVDELNEILQRNKATELKKVFGTTSPFKLTYNITATDLLTGKTYALAKPQNLSGIIVKPLTGALPNSKLTISIPSTNTLYKIDVRATITDPFGNKESETTTIYSHYLKTDTTPKAKALVYQALSGDLPMTNPFAKGNDDRYRKDRILHIMLENQGEDGQFTIDELEMLKKL